MSLLCPQPTLRQEMRFMIFEKPTVEKKRIQQRREKYIEKQDERPLRVILC